MSPAFPITIRRLAYLLLLIIVSFNALTIKANVQVTLPTETEKADDIAMVKDIMGSAYSQATQSSSIQAFATTANYLFFLTAPAVSASRENGIIVAPDTSWDLWRTDGTSEGTQRVIDLAGYTRAETSPQAGRQWLYLFAHKNGQTYLFRTDGDQTTLLGAIPSNQAVVAQALAPDDTFYYATGQSAQTGITLWSAGVQAAAPTKIWESGRLANPIQDTILHATSTYIYLIAQPQGESPTLYATTHNSNSLSPLRVLDAWPSAASNSQDHFYFFVTNTDNTQLWRSSGTITSTLSLFATERVAAVKTYLLTFKDDTEQDQIYFAYAFPEISPQAPYTELWHSDGTLPDTQKLMLYGGGVPISAPFRHLDKIYIEVADLDPLAPAYERGPDDLLVSDGTPAGSHHFVEFNQHTPIYALVGTRLFSNGNNVVDAFQGELRVYDFVDKTPSAIDLTYGSGTSIIDRNPWATFKDILYFSATNGIDGVELWRSDGTQAGTWQVKNINTKPVAAEDFLPPYEIANFLPTELTGGSQYLYFVADEGSDGPHVYRSDGTAAGTVLLDHPVLLQEWTDPTSLMVHGNTLYFMARHRYQMIEQGQWWEWRPNYAIWQSDGSTNGTRLLVDQIASPPSSLAVVNNRLLILGAVSDFATWELWRLNDAQNALELLVDFRLEPAIPGLYKGIEPVITDRLMLFQNPGESEAGNGLWRSDGTQAGTFRIDGYSAHQLFVGDTLFYGLQYDSSPDVAVRYWRTNGTPSGTQEIAAFSGSENPQRTAGSAIVGGDRLYFTVAQDNKPTQPWTSDGSTSKAYLLKELNTIGAYATRGHEMMTDSNVLYLMEIHESFDYPPVTMDLWDTEDAADQTHNMGKYYFDLDSYPILMMAHHGQIFYTVQREREIRLYRSSDNPLCNFFVADLDSEKRDRSRYIFEYAKVGDFLYFVANDPTYGDELWAANLPGPIECLYTYLPSTRRP